MKFLDLDDIADTADGDPLAREVTVTLKLRAPTPGRIGAVLDDVIELARTRGVGADMDVPGYVEIWYGWEEEAIAHG